MRKPILSKYPFIKGIDCEKYLHMHYYASHLKTPINDQLQDLFDKGTYVGEVGRLLYEGGIDMSQGGTLTNDQIAQNTMEALKADYPILYEATFKSADGTKICKTDIFVKSKKRTVLVEVKSSTSIDLPNHILDVAFQLRVIKESGYEGPPLKIYIAYLNKNYVRGENLDISELFIMEDVTRRAQDAQTILDRYLDKSLQILNRKNAPNTSISMACVSPYKCAFKEHCWKNIPQETIFSLGRIQKKKAFKLFEEGILKFDQITENISLSEKQWIEVSAAQKKKAIIDKTKINRFLEEIGHGEPMYFMDFESYVPAIPKYFKTKPYQQICFQFCVLFKIGDKIERKEFLARPGRDSRREFIESLLNVTQGDYKVVVYNQTFEIARLKELSIEYPDLTEQIEHLINRIVDLMAPFAARHYYHPAMHGSHSLKAVLPVLVDDLSYDNLNIKNGAMAMYKYDKMYEMSYADQLQTQRDLLDYCYVDVFAMVRIIEALENLCLT